MRILLLGYTALRSRQAMFPVAQRQRDPSSARRLRAPLIPLWRRHRVGDPLVPGRSSTRAAFSASR
jgi:hypothetical protein